MKTSVFIGLAVLWPAVGFAWTEFPVYATGDVQMAADVSNGVVVWQEYVNAGSVYDWDIYGIDLVNNPSTLISVAAYEADQTAPSIWGKWVAWEDDYYGDVDIWVSDISTPAAPVPYSLTPYEKDQAYPSVHGNTVAWQHQILNPQTQQLDWDIYMADITDPNTPPVYSVASYEKDQQFPAVYRNTILWQDKYYGDNDIYGADVWLRNAPASFSVSATTLEQTAPAVSGDIVVWQEDFGSGDVDIYGADISDPEHPVEFEIAGQTGSQSKPDISGNIVVWQDNRNGNWDIYGYNMLTKKEFRITTNTANQTNPAIDGKLVVFEDDRSGKSTIYAVWLDGNAIADCTAKLAGDANGDCKVNMADMAAIAKDWLKCNLEPATACGG